MVLIWVSSRAFSTSSWAVICQTTGPQPLPKWFLHLIRSRASSFKSEYPVLSPRSSSNLLRLLPRLLVTSIRPCIFPSITCFRRQFLRKIWPIQLAFRFLISCRIFLCSLTLSNTSSFLTWSVQPHFKTFRVFLIYCPKRPSFSTIQSHAPNVACSSNLSPVPIELYLSCTEHDLFHQSGQNWHNVENL
jgi:hypothetical protein